jgi:hypothetical protein
MNALPRFKFSQWLGRVAYHECIGWHIPDDDGAHTDTATITKFQSLANDSGCSNINTLANKDISRDRSEWRD